VTQHVLMITDKSGSMWHLRDDVIGGQRQYLQIVADDEGGAADYRITQVLFDTEVYRLDDEVPIGGATRFDQHIYSPGGNTALLDAIGDTVQRYLIKPRAEGDRVLLVIQTDGAENSSREWNRKRVAELLTTVQEEHGWVVIFSGTGVEGWAERDNLNAGKFSTRNASTSQGTRSAYTAYAGTTRAWAAGDILRSEDAARRTQRDIDEQGGNDVA